MASQYWLGRINNNTRRLHCLDCPPPRGAYSSALSPVQCPADTCDRCGAEIRGRLVNRNSADTKAAT